MIVDILEFVARTIVGALILIVMLPLALIVSAPFILVGSILISGSWSGHVQQGFVTVTKKWFDWGLFVFP